jgi:hypothetical protein
MKGVWGKVLKVDLTNGTCKAEACRKKSMNISGGAGMAAYTCGKCRRARWLNPANRLTCRRPHDRLKQTGGPNGRRTSRLPSMNLTQRPSPVSGSR